MPFRSRRTDWQSWAWTIVAYALAGLGLGLVIAGRELGTNVSVAGVVALLAGNACLARWAWRLRRCEGSDERPAAIIWAAAVLVNARALIYLFF